MYLPKRHQCLYTSPTNYLSSDVHSPFPNSVAISKHFIKIKALVHWHQILHHSWLELHSPNHMHCPAGTPFFSCCYAWKKEFKYHMYKLLQQARKKQAERTGSAIGGPATSASKHWSVQIRNSGKMDWQGMCPQSISKQVNVHSSVHWTSKGIPKYAMRRCVAGTEDSAGGKKKRDNVYAVY